MVFLVNGCERKNPCHVKIKLYINMVRDFLERQILNFRLLPMPGKYLLWR